MDSKPAPLFLSASAIKGRLAALRTTQGALGDSIGIPSRSRMSVICCGNLAVKPALAARIAEALGLPLEAIVDHPSTAVAAQPVGDGDES